MLIHRWTNIDAAQIVTGFIGQSTENEQEMRKGNENAHTMLIQKCYSHIYIPYAFTSCYDLILFFIKLFLFSKVSSNHLLWSLRVNKWAPFTVVHSFTQSCRLTVSVVHRICLRDASKLILNYWSWTWTSSTPVKEILNVHGCLYRSGMPYQSTVVYWCGLHGWLDSKCVDLGLEKKKKRE